MYSAFQFGLAAINVPLFIEGINSGNALQAGLSLGAIVFLATLGIMGLRK